MIFKVRHVDGERGEMYPKPRIEYVDSSILVPVDHFVARG